MTWSKGETYATNWYMKLHAYANWQYLVLSLRTRNLVCNFAVLYFQYPHNVHSDDAMKVKEIERERELYVVYFVPSFTLLLFFIVFLSTVHSSQRRKHHHKDSYRLIDEKYALNRGDVFWIHRHVVHQLISRIHLRRLDHHFRIPIFRFLRQHSNSKRTLNRTNIFQPLNKHPQFRIHHNRFHTSKEIFTASGRQFNTSKSLTADINNMTPVNLKQPERMQGRKSINAVITYARLLCVICWILCLNFPFSRRKYFWQSS